MVPRRNSPFSFKTEEIVKKLAEKINKDGYEKEINSQGIVTVRQ